MVIFPNHEEKTLYLGLLITGMKEESDCNGKKQIGKTYTRLWKDYQKEIFNSNVLVFFLFQHIHR